MGWPLRTLVLCALLPAQLPSQAGTKPFFEERLLGRAPIVVRARFGADQSCFDVEVAAFDVVRTLRGAVHDRILVLGATQLSKRLRDVDRLLFLRQEPSGCLYRIVDSIDLVDEADAIETFVRGFLELVDEVDPARKREKLMRLIRDGLALRSEFPRKLAAREIEQLARRRPPVLTADEIAGFESLMAAVPPEETGRVRAALDGVEDAWLRHLAGTQAGIPRGAKRARFVKAVGEYLRAVEGPPAEEAVDRIAFQWGAQSAPFLVKLLDDEAMRDRALLHLGAMQWQAAAPDVAGRLRANEGDTDALVACLGQIGGDAAVDLVARHLSTADHFDVAAIALARIGTPRAQGILDAMLRELRKDPRQAPRVETIERVRSAAFLEQDTALRLEARGRYPRE